MSPVDVGTGGSPLRLLVPDGVSIRTGGSLCRARLGAETVVVKLDARSGGKWANDELPGIDASCNLDATTLSLLLTENMSEERCLAADCDISAEESDCELTRKVSSPPHTCC